VRRLARRGGPRRGDGLVANRWRCPLTGVRGSPKTAATFDIYLPPSLARYNKQVFGTLFVPGRAGDALGLAALKEW